MNASGELATGGGLAGFLPMMDPLQMLAGLQNAALDTIEPVDTILKSLDPALGLPGWLDDGLQWTYDLTNALDGFLLSGWTDVVGWLQNTLADIGINGLDLASMIGPDAIFDGLPLISGEPVLAGIGLVFDLLNFFGA
ncbi:hypothetical protein BHQ15_03380 [Mycolicibacillus koreensis]|nr:hypothetical protein BHQ15_03380 [Mycolicibacillus koreensis]